MGIYKGIYRIFEGSMEIYKGSIRDLEGIYRYLTEKEVGRERRNRIKKL